MVDDHIDEADRRLSLRRSRRSQALTEVPDVTFCEGVTVKQGSEQVVYHPFHFVVF